MERIIINIRDKSDITNEDALKYALHVVKRGKVSETAKGKQYCFHTVFNNTVHVSVTKQKSGTETFNIYSHNI